MNNETNIQKTLASLQRLSQLDYSPLNKKYKKRDFTTKELEDGGVNYFGKATMPWTIPADKMAAATALVVLLILVSIFAMVFWRIKFDGIADFAVTFLIVTVSFAIAVGVFGANRNGYSLKWLAFARKNQVSYTSAGSRAPWALDNFGESGRGMWNTIELDGIKLSQFHYEWEVSGGDGGTTTTGTEFNVLAVPATRRINNAVVYVINRRKKPQTLMINRLKKINLEGDFNKYFDVYAREDNKDVRYILTPDIMSAMIELGGNYSYAFDGQSACIINPEQYLNAKSAKQFADDAVRIVEAIS